jgi:hypothetical protein
VFHEFLQSKYEPISVDAECVRQIVETGHGRLTEVGSHTLDRPLDLKELQILLQKVRGNKTPGRDGIVWVFFTEKWEEVKEDWLELFSEIS